VISHLIRVPLLRVSSGYPKFSRRNNPKKMGWRIGQKLVGGQKIAGGISNFSGRMVQNLVGYNTEKNGLGYRPKLSGG
jgi:hypothetical protein